jgi:hypothetical protein
MTELSEVAREYVETLILTRPQKEEVENVLTGYMVDCIAKDKRIDELEKALKDIKIHQELVSGQKGVTWHIVDRALNGTIG